MFLGTLSYDNYADVIFQRTNHIIFPLVTFNCSKLPSVVLTDGLFIADTEG